MTQSTPSSYLFQALKEVFQCGSLNDVSDYVATTVTSASTNARTNKNKPVAGGTNNRQEEQEAELPGLQRASSSASSIYVVPSREALEELVRDSRGTRRQGLFDMQRMFACGSREQAVDDDHDVVMTKDIETSSDAAGSGFSRSANRRHPRRESIGSSSAHSCSGPHPAAQVDDAYHLRIHLSPPKPAGAGAWPKNHHDNSVDYEWRRTMSDTMSQLPESKSTSDCSSLASGGDQQRNNKSLLSTTATLSNE